MTSRLMFDPQSAIHNPHSPQRLGLFGGSFDPVHRGHITLAECCLEQAKLDCVWIIPAAEQPLKPQGPVASGADRLAMLCLIADNCSEFQICDIEIQRGGVSYTIDTLTMIRAEQPQAELFFLMGADSLAELSEWHRAEDVCRLAMPLIVHRAGADKPDFTSLRQIVPKERLELIEASQVEMPATPISSSQIRKLIAKGDEWEELVTPQVASYIRQHGLYGTR